MFKFIALPIMVVGLAVLIFALVPHPSKTTKQVVAYCAQDEEYAEPILREFNRQTGIKVRAVYDNEAVKTVGLANRLLGRLAQSALRAEIVPRNRPGASGAVVSPMPRRAR